MPVPSRIRSVAAATYASQISGSAIATVSPPGILPSGEYGYGDSYPVGTTTCSTVQSDSNPSSSASRAMPTASSGSPSGPAFANAIPNFTVSIVACLLLSVWGCTLFPG